MVAVGRYPGEVGLENDRSLLRGDYIGLQPTTINENCGAICQIADRITWNFRK